MPMQIGFYIIIYLFSFNAWAWESYPEYIGLVESERASFAQPTKIDSEYQSDFLTYTPSAAWHSQWLQANKALQFSVGSLSSKRFLLDNRFKFQTELLKDFDFDLIYFDERHFESDNESLMVQFSKWLFQRRYRLAIYGELETNKAQDDLGLSLSWFYDESTELKLFHTLVDYSRNERNESSDEFLTAPLSTGLVFRTANSNGEFVEASLRVESKTRWLLPDELAHYNYWRRSAQIYWRTRTGDAPSAQENYFNMRFFSEEKFEEKYPTSGASTVVQESWRTKRYFMQFEFEKGAWIYGLHSALRDYDTELGEVGQHHSLPYISKGFGEGLHQWRVGYELTQFREAGSVVLRGAQADDYALEHRVNVTYKAQFNEESTMKVLLTFDGDELGTGETWEGGNIQFRSEF